MKRALLILSALCLFVSASVVQAQGGGGYELTWTSIDAGGGTTPGGLRSSHL